MKGQKAKKKGADLQAYEEMLTPRNDANMEKVDEVAEDN